jgi:hypothetical protein
MDAEVSTQIGAELYECSEGRTAHRNASLEAGRSLEASV